MSKIKKKMRMLLPLILISRCAVQFRYGYLAFKKRDVNKGIFSRAVSLCIPDSMRPNPDCIVKIMKALVRIHVASS